jgi:hypothetical protein
MECLAADYTEVWAPSAVAPLVRFADRVRPLAGTGLDLVGIDGVKPPASVIAALSAFDSIVSWYGANREEFRLALARLRLPVRFCSPLPYEHSGMHAVDYQLAQVGCPLGAAPHIDCPRKDKGFAIIHPFSGSPRKNWPLDRFRALADRLPLPVEWSAGPEEDLKEARRFSDLYELACHLAGARVYVGNDSGITHLAAAVGTPVVAVFGPTDPAVWGPRGRRVQTMRQSEGWPDVEQVAAATFNAL